MKPGTIYITGEPELVGTFPALREPVGEHVGVAAVNLRGLRSLTIKRVTTERVVVHRFEDA